MSLDAIPPGAEVLIDANILIYARRGMSAQCRQLLERCARREINGAVTIISIAEFCHRRMMQEAQSRGLTGANPARALAQNQALVRQLTKYAQEVQDLLAGELRVLAIEAADFAQAIELQQKYGLLTNDSLNLAAALRAARTLLATADAHFDSIPEISVFKPDDV
jgi:predicted nucleic acid-binding protein